MLSLKFHKVSLAIFLLCLSVGLALLISACFLTDWMVVNISIQNGHSKDSILAGPYYGTYRFGLKEFCFRDGFETSTKKCSAEPRKYEDVFKVFPFKGAQEFTLGRYSLTI